MTQPLTVLFSHGQESGPWGGKIRRLAATAEAAGCRVDSIDYTELPTAGDRVERLLDHCPGDGRLLLAGSSMGGYVAAAAARQRPVDALFLLAPAFRMPGVQPVGAPLCADHRVLVHGWRDDVVPVDTVLETARADGSELHIVDDGHRLTDSLDAIDAWFRQLLDRLA